MKILMSLILLLTACSVKIDMRPWVSATHTGTVILHKYDVVLESYEIGIEDATGHRHLFAQRYSMFGNEEANYLELKRIYTLYEVSDTVTIKWWERQAEVETDEQG